MPGDLRAAFGKVYGAVTTADPVAELRQCRS
jgi:hypothetical protein